MGDLALLVLLMGIGATLTLDLWALLLNRLFGFGLPNWALVGRWFAHLPSGQFIHENISASTPIANEQKIGWIAHYAVGVLFALATILIGGNGWAASPTWPLPIAVGLITVGCGWFVLQPGMGAGIAASKRPDRVRVRILNLLGHTVFGLGLWGVALLMR